MILSKASSLQIFAVLVVLFLIRIVLVSRIGLHNDEAYYWVWTQHLQLGYFDHPPIISWLSAISQSLIETIIPNSWLQQSPLYWAKFSFRFLPMLLGSCILPFLMLHTLKKAQNHPYNWWQVTTLITSPVLIFGPLIVTPDVPFFFFWTLCLYLLIHIENKKPSDATSSVLLLGFFLGMAALSKYTALLAALLVVMSSLRWIQVFVVAGVSFVMFLPNLYWQLTSKTGSEGGGIIFQLKHGFGSWDSIGRAHHWMPLGDMWITQIFFWTPLVFIFLIPALFFAQAPKKNRWTLFKWAVFPLLFFSLSALSRKVEANWPLMGLIPALLLVLSLSRNSRWYMSALIGLNLSSALLALILMVRPSTLAPLFANWNPRAASELQKPSRLHEIEGWDGLYNELKNALKHDAAPVEIASYQLFSQMLFHDRYSHEPNFLKNRLKFWKENSRRSQFNDWPQYNLKPEEKTGTFWILSYADDPEKVFPCPIVQELHKSDELKRTFVLMKCEATLDL